MNNAPFPLPEPVLLRGSPLSQQETIELLLRQSRRRTETVPVRRAFVQDTLDGAALVTKPGPLHKLMRHEKALDLLLLLYMVTSGGDFGAVERAETWSRAIGLSFQYDGSAGSAVSRLWNRLAEHNLVRRGTRGRLAKVTKLLEDGSGQPYTTPSGSERGPRKDVYFRIPFQYWRDELYKQLDMPGKVMLLIGMSLRAANFSLPQTATFAGYYGISEATLRRGITKLVEKEILTTTGSETYATNETATGYGTRTRYAFSPPYDLNVNNTEREAMTKASEARISPTPTMPNLSFPLSLSPASARSAKPGSALDAGTSVEGGETNK